MKSGHDRFLVELNASLGDGTFVRLVVSAPTDEENQPAKILGRLVELKAGPHLSLTRRYASRDVVENVPVSEVADRIHPLVAVQFRNALLETTRKDWQLTRTKSGKERLVAHPPSSSETPSRLHDRSKQSILDVSANDWLHGLGVMDGDGKVRASMADKHAQINRYLEIITHLARECGWTDKERQPACPTLADMGSGKGYLTFGLWHLFRRVWKRPVRVIGVEAREDLVKATNDLARKIGGEGLEFVAGTIGSVRLPGVDGLIALHACNTATDDAIRRGIQVGAMLIVVAPCCHKELRPQLGKPAPLAPVLAHGIMAGRMAEWATDGLRALFLEWAGYRTKMIEFVSSEHTPKNLMIAAIRQGKPFTDSRARERIEEFKAFFGVRTHALDPLLNELGRD